MQRDLENDDDPVVRLLVAVWLHRGVAIVVALIVIALGTAWVLRRGVTHTYTTVIEVGLAGDVPLEGAEGVRTWLNSVAIPERVAQILDARQQQNPSGLDDFASLIAGVPTASTAPARPLVLITMRASDEHSAAAIEVVEAIATRTLERHKAMLARRKAAIEGRIQAREIDIRRLEAEETRVRSTTPPEGVGVAGWGSALSLLQTQIADARDLVALLQNDLRFLTESSIALEVTRERAPDGAGNSLLLLAVLAAAGVAGTAASVVVGAMQSVARRTRASRT